MSSDKCNLLMLTPGCYRPDLSNFSGKYKILSVKYSGHILCWTSSEFDGLMLGDFVLHALTPPTQYDGLQKLKDIIEFVRKGIALHREKAFDLIVAPDPLIFGIIGVLIKKATKAKLLVEINGHLLEAGFLKSNGLIGAFRKFIFLQTIKWVLQNADGIKCINTLLVDEVRQLREADQGGIHCFHDYVPISSFAPSSEDRNYIFFAGHPFHIKGVDLLIEAFMRLHKDFPECRLLIMGHNRIDIEKYRQQASSCDRIEFLKPVYYDEIIQYFRDCLLFVLPSRSEAMGRVLLEAMASGKAVVASRAGGIPEVVENGSTGLLFENENVADLEEKLRMLLSNRSMRQAMGDAGRKRVETFFSEEKYFDLFVKMIDGILSEKQVAGRNCI